MEYLSCYAKYNMIFEKKYKGQAGLPAKASAQAGQMLLVVILVVIITLTIGLSLATRTITNLRSSTEEAESQKALAAAEAGIERAIQSNLDIPEASLSNGSKFITSVSKVGEQNRILLNAGNPVSKNEGIDVWFEGHNDDGTLNGVFKVPSNPILYWQSPESSTICGDSAIQVIVVTINAGTTKTYRYAYDGCGARANNFTVAETTGYNFVIDGIAYSFRNRTSTTANQLASSLAGGDNVVFMRVVPIYKDAIIVINNDNVLSPQGYQIDSTGKFGEANRKIRVFKGWPQTYLPYISYGLFVASN